MLQSRVNTNYQSLWIIKIQVFFLIVLLSGQLSAQIASESEAYQSLAKKLYAEALSFDSIGNSARALQSLEKAIFLNEAFEPAHRKSGEIEIALADYNTAINHLNSAINIAPTPEAHLLRAQAFFRLEKNSEGLQDISKAKELAEGKPFDVQKTELLKEAAQAVYNQGMSFRENGNTSEAFQKFDEALFLFPDFSEALYQKGVIFFINSDYISASHNFEKAVNLKPYPDAALYHIRTEIKNGKTADIQQKLKAVNYQELQDKYQILYAVTAAEVADVVYSDALQSLDLGDNEAAQLQLATVTEIAPDFFGGYYQLGILAQKNNEPEKAIDFFVKAIELEPNKPSYLQLGAVKTQQGNLDEAFEALALAKEKSITPATDPQNARPSLLVENKYLKLPDENYASAKGDKKNDEKPEPDTPVADEPESAPKPKPEIVTESQGYFELIDKADELFRDQKNEDALELYKQASQIDPLKYYPKTRIAQITALLETPSATTPTPSAEATQPDAEEKPEEKMMPEEKDIFDLPGTSTSEDEVSDESLKLYNEGLALYYDSDFDGALDKFTRAISLDPGFSDAYYNSGFIKLNQGFYEEAIADFDIVLSISPNDKAYFYKGRAMVGLYRFEEAAVQFTLAIELNPDFYYAFNNRGNVFFQLGNYQAAINDFNAVIELNPDYVFAYNNRGNAHFKLDNYTEAIADYNIAIELRPDYGFAYLNRGITHELLGNMDEACSDWEKASALGIQVAGVYFQEQCIKE